MTKKDYELIAYCIFTVNMHPAIDAHKLNEREYLIRVKFAEWFADNLQSKNTRFDRLRFIKACLGADVPCVVCGGKRDVEALKCSKC